MRKIVLAALLAAALATVWACTKQESVIYNGCKGSWVKILQGTKVRLDRLDYGQPAGFQSSWFVDNGDTYRIELVAVGYRLSDNSPMGAARRSFYLGGGNSNPAGPSNDLPSWNITQLFDSANNNNCETK